MREALPDQPTDCLSRLWPESTEEVSNKSLSVGIPRFQRPRAERYKYRVQAFKRESVHDTSCSSVAQEEDRRGWYEKSGRG